MKPKQFQLKVSEKDDPFVINYTSIEYSTNGNVEYIITMKVANSRVYKSDLHKLLGVRPYSISSGDYTFENEALLCLIRYAFKDDTTCELTFSI